MTEPKQIQAPPAPLGLLNLGRKDTGEDLKAIGVSPIFILSTGRTGTQFLARYFDRNPEVCAVHEPKPSRGLRFWTVAYLEGVVDRSMMTRTLRRYRTGFFQKINEPTYIESNNFLAGFVESLIDEFDEPLVVHVIRDPRTYVRSAINNGASTGLKGMANRFVPFAHLKMDRTSQHPAILRSALYWRLLNSHLHEVGKGYDSYHMFKYEDLFRDGSEQFRRLVDLIGTGGNDLFAHEDRKVNESPRNVIPPWREWSEGQQRVVMNTCGDLMDLFGYHP